MAKTTAMLVLFTALLSVLMGIDGAHDCSEFYRAGYTAKGLYYINPGGGNHVLVYCDMVTGGTYKGKGGWTVIQRRMDGSVNFYRPWSHYRNGFGDKNGEYWLGLENIHQLTARNRYMLRVDMEDFQGRKGYALYSSFSVGSEADGYRLHVSEFRDGGAGDSLTYANGAKFTTFDKDQDSYSSGNCAKQYLGAFWYQSCHHANPNGVYIWGQDGTHFAIGAVWYTWRHDFSVGLKSIQMKIKRVSQTRC